MTLHHVAEESGHEQYHRRRSELDLHEQRMLDDILQDVDNAFASQKWFRRLHLKSKPRRFAIVASRCSYRSALEEDGHVISELTLGPGVTLELVDRLLSIARLRGFALSAPVARVGGPVACIEFTLDQNAA